MSERVAISLAAVSYENVPRMLGEGTRAVIKKDSYPIPPIFGYWQRQARLRKR